MFIMLILTCCIKNLNNYFEWKESRTEKNIFLIDYNFETYLISNDLLASYRLLTADKMLYLCK